MEAYFNRIGGHPSEVSKAPPKKRGRKSHDQSPPAKKTKSQAPVRAGRRGMKLGEEENDKGRPWPDVKVTSDWMPPKPRKDAWEDILLEVQTLSADPDGTKWAFVLWSVEDEKGVKRKGKVLLQSASVAAPQAVSWHSCSTVGILTGITGHPILREAPRIHSKRSSAGGIAWPGISRFRQSWILR